jgi:hypothetical protein
LDYGAWTGHRIPDDRSSWHPVVRGLYEYWLTIKPPGRLPGRQHIKPEDIARLLPRLWIVDIHTDPFRLRFRLVGTAISQTVHREFTGWWFDEAQPEAAQNIELLDRYRFMIETKQATWRRGLAWWRQEPGGRLVENCLAPLATDGENVDKVIAAVIFFDADGREL